ncbi:MAG: porin, partial [Alphaproteobacteria bacterium]|nr:porin [Alphaproteobacteria bacterium]
RYISPRISGFQIGMDYSPEATQDDDGFPTEASNNGVNPENVWSVAANYMGDFDGFKLQASAGFQGIGDGNGVTGQDPYNFGLGLRLGVGGFTLSGSWTHENDFGGAIEDRDVFGGAVSYKDGPMRVGLDVAYGMQTYVAAGAPDTKQVSVQLGGTYVLGPGVEARGSIYYADQQDGNGTAGNDANGFAVVGGLRLVF